MVVKMQKKLMAAVVTSVLAGQSMALDVFDNDVSKLTVGGRLGLKVDNRARSLDDDMSRINYRFTHKLSDNLTAMAHQEWRYNSTAKGPDNNLFSNRLGFFRLDHNDLGMVTVGKQYSTYAEIADWSSDRMMFNGGNGLGMYTGMSADGGVHGTGRADGAFSYRNTFGGLKLGLQYQLKDNGENATGVQWRRESGQQLMVSYDLPMGFSLGYAYNETRFERTASHNGEAAKAHVFGAKFVMDALYIGVNYAEMKNHTNTLNQVGGNGVAKQANTIDLYASYDLDRLADGLTVYTGYQDMGFSKGADGNKSKEEMKIASIGGRYKIGPTEFGLQYDKRDNKNSEGSKVRTDNTITANVRYYF